MKNNKAFTLVEVLAVIVIVSLIMGIAVPAIVTSINNKRSQISDVSKEMIYDATQLYISEAGISDSCISLETLVNAGKLKAPVRDLKNDKDIPLNYYIKVTDSGNNNYDYELVKTCSSSGYIVQSLPERYQKLDYIEGDGTKYVEVNYKLKPTTGIDVDFAFTSTSPTQQRLFGQSTLFEDPSISYDFYINGASKFAYAYKDGVGNWVPMTAVAADTNKHNLKMNINGRVRIDNTAYNQAIQGTPTYTAAHNLTILARYDIHNDTIGYYAKAKIYHFAIYESDTLIHYLVPCKLKEEGINGLYDIKSDVFYELK